MIELTGRYATAKIFTTNPEPGAVAQIEHLLEQEFVSGSRIRVMPDMHAGMGCTIGTTMTVGDRVVPNLVGVDIGCGMETAVLATESVDLARLDGTIHRLIPAGFATRRTPHPYNEAIDLGTLRCRHHVNTDRAVLSIGTLGGGNHFIELGRDEAGRLYLVVHSGSRNLGKQVCEHYQKLAADTMQKQAKAAGGDRIDRVLAYLEGGPLADYLHDMAIVQCYADINRRAIIHEITENAGLAISDQFPTVHNYIDLGAMILRKGAISAMAGERVLIPLNMRDGSLLCIGKGNEDWNYSAPHGAGRVMSRTTAKANISMSEYEKTMQGVYSSTINKKTIDEAPFAYKPAAEILAHIGDTVTVTAAIRPLYNFKAAE